jgi:hypothetical protein
MIGCDACDIKYYPSWPNIGITLDVCVAYRFCLNATTVIGAEEAAAFEIRGDVLETNIRVINMAVEVDVADGQSAIAGIRINGDVDSNNNRKGGRKARVIGGSVTSTKLDNEGSETLNRVYGVRVGDSYAAISGVVVENCYVGFIILQTGDSTPTGGTIMDCTAINCKGSGGDGRALSINSGCIGHTVSIAAIDCDIGLVSSAGNNTVDMSLEGCTADHTLSVGAIRLGNYRFIKSSALSASISRPSFNNMRDEATIWGLTAPILRLRSTLDGTWGSPFYDGGISFESEDTSGVGAGVRAQVRAVHTGSSAGATNIHLLATTVGGLTDGLIVRGDRVIIPIANVNDFADDTAAAAGGVQVGGIYRTASVMKIRVS